MVRGVEGEASEIFHTLLADGRHAVVVGVISDGAGLISRDEGQPGHLEVPFSLLNWVTYFYHDQA